MNRLMGKNSFRFSFFNRGQANNMSTDGVDVNVWPVEVESEALGISKITFSVWDFAGQGKINKSTIE